MTTNVYDASNLPAKEEQVAESNPGESIVHVLSENRTHQDESDSGRQPPPKEKDEDQLLHSSTKAHELTPMQGITNAGFVADDDSEPKKGPRVTENGDAAHHEQGNNYITSNDKRLANHEIFIPEDALLNHHSAQARVKKKKNDKKQTTKQEKVPLRELKNSVVIPLNGISEKELKEYANNYSSANNVHDEKQQQETGTVPVANPVTGEKVSGTKKAFEEYFIPANTHKKFLRREKLYLTKNKRNLCCGWKRFLIFTLITVIFAIAVLVGVLAATGVLQAESGIETSQLPHPASMSQNMGPPPTHQLPLTTLHPHRRPTFLSTKPWMVDDVTTTSTSNQGISHTFPIVTSVPIIVPSRVVEGNFTILNRNFSTSLMNNMSEEFQELARELESQLHSIFNEREGLTSVKVLKFQQGSIVVEYVTTWRTQPDGEILNRLFKLHLHNHNGYLGNYLIDSSMIALQDNYSSPASFSSTITPITRLMSTTNTYNDVTESRSWNKTEQGDGSTKEATEQTSPQGQPITEKIELTTVAKETTEQTTFNKQEEPITENNTEASNDNTTDYQVFSNATERDGVPTTDLPRTSTQNTQESQTEGKILASAPTSETTEEHFVNETSNSTPSSDLTTPSLTTPSEEKNESAEMTTEILPMTTTAGKTQNEQKDESTAVTTIQETTPVDRREPDPHFSTNVTETSPIPDTTPPGNAPESTTESNDQSMSVILNERPIISPSTTEDRRQASSVKPEETSTITETTTALATNTTKSNENTDSKTEEKEVTEASNTEKPFSSTSGEVQDTTTDGTLTTELDKPKTSNMTKRPKVVDGEDPFANVTLTNVPSPQENATTDSHTEEEMANTTETIFIESKETTTFLNAQNASADVLTTVDNNVANAEDTTTTQKPQTVSELITVAPEELTPTATTSLDSITENSVKVPETTPQLNESKEESSSETPAAPTVTIGNGTSTEIGPNPDLTTSVIPSEKEPLPVTEIEVENQTEIVTTTVASSTENADSNIQITTVEPTIITNEALETNLPDKEDTATTSSTEDSTSTAKPEEDPKILILDSNSTLQSSTTVTGNNSDGNMFNNLMPQVLNESDMNDSYPINGTFLLGDQFPSAENTTDVQELNDTSVYTDGYNTTSYFGNATESLLMTEDNRTMSEVDPMTYSDLENDSLVTDEQNGTGFHSFDASNGSTVEGCSEDQFMCPGELECRSLFQKCDAVHDCADSFDESMCEEDCGLNFMCYNSTVCIKAAARCDGVYDCENGSDEEGCSPTECDQHDVKCLDKSACIKPLNICDGHYNCHDKSDERDCVDRSACMSTGRFYCSDGLCLPPGLHCDGSKDCSKGEDEENCTCPENWFQCSDGKCIEGIYRCDGQQNCSDGSDEMECVRVDANNVVEVYNSALNTWSVMCEDNWTFEDGNELCQELGFSSAESVSHLYIFNNGSNWSSLRNATEIKNSTYWIGNTHFTNNCSSSRAATVTCTKYECGKFKLKEKDGFLEQWPFMVMIHSREQSCRAEVLTPLWLITSAECILKFPQNTSEWYAQVQQLVLNSPEIDPNTTQIRDVELTVMHPHSSKFRSPILHDFDMALVRLKDSLDFKNLAAICLPEAEVKPGITCFTGSLSMNKLRDTPALQAPVSFLALMVQERDSCNHPGHYNGWVSSRMLCTESSNANKKLCSNDDAAPLTCYAIEGKWYLAGILTYQRECGIYYQQPAIYANIFAMKKYIEKVIGMKQYNLTYDASTYIIQDETTILPNTTEPFDQNTTVPLYWPNNFNMTDTTDSSIPEEGPIGNDSSVLSGKYDSGVLPEDNRDVNRTLLLQSFRDDEPINATDLVMDENWKDDLNLTHDSNETISDQDVTMPYENVTMWTVPKEILDGLNETFPQIPTPLQLSTAQNISLHGENFADDLSTLRPTTENGTSLEDSTDASLQNENATLGEETANLLRNNGQNVTLENDLNREDVDPSQRTESTVQVLTTTSEPNNDTVEKAHALGPEVIYNSPPKETTHQEPMSNTSPFPVENHLEEEQTHNSTMGQNTSLKLGDKSEISIPMFTSTMESLLRDQENSSVSFDSLNTTGANSPSPITSSTTRESTGNSFHCMDFPQSIAVSSVCNGIYDCEDESDEWNCVRINSTNNMLEVRHHAGDWFPICLEGWDQRMALQVCQQLGYRSTSYSSRTNHLQANASTTFQVSGTNNELLQGSLNFSAPCTDGKVVAISCSEINCGLWSVMNEDHQLKSRREERYHAPEREWPSVAYLRQANRSCTASILSPYWVITAHACLVETDQDKMNYSEWSLFALNTNQPDVIMQEIQVELHVSSPSGLALVKLVTPLSFGHHAHAICLPDQETRSGQLCVSAGWEAHNSTEINSGQKLEYTQLSILSPAECSGSSHDNETLGSLICTGPANQEKSTFQAPIGAPLMCMFDNRWQLHGISTAKASVQPTTQPYVAYSDVAPQSQWIYNIIEKQSHLTAMA